MAVHSGPPGQPQPAPATGPPAPGSEHPAKLGKYEIQKKIGAGGMGAVFLALDTQLRRTVALKLLPREKAQNPILVRRFQAEAQAAACLKHDNIVTVYEAGEAGGFYYIALEYVEGTDVDNLVQRRGVLPAKRSQDIIKQVAKALQHASEQGIVHRDIKPANLLIRRDGTVKLADMGLARSLDEAADTGITRAGTTVGTVDYMAPEQARDSKAADTRSDIYSLGCTWYHMLTGAPPFPEGSLTNKLRSHAETPPPDPRLKNPGVPEAVVAVLNRMMAKQPKDRYQTANELIADLENSNLSRDAVSESIFSDEAESQGERVIAREPEPAASRPIQGPPPRETKQNDEDDEEQAGRSYTSMLYAALALLFVGAVVGLGWMTRGFSTAFDAPGEKIANPFHLPDPAPVNTVNKPPDDKSVDPASAKGKTPASSDPASQKKTPNSTSDTATKAGDAPPKEGPEKQVAANVPQQGHADDPTQPASGVPTGAPSTSGGPTSDAQTRRVHLEHLGLPAWVGEARSPAGLAVLTVRAGAAGERQYATLNEALRHVPARGAVISLEGAGPFPLRPAQITDKTRVIIQADDRAGAANHPLIVMLPGEKSVESHLEFAATTVELKGVHFALDAAAFKAGVPAAMVHVSAGDAICQNCSFAIKGKPSAASAALRLDGQFNSGGGRPHDQTRLLLEKTLVRGQNLSAFRAELGHADIVVYSSLVYSGLAPVVSVAGSPQKSPGGLQDLRFAASTFCALRNAFELGRAAEPPAAIAVSLRDCVVSAAPGSTHPTLVSLRDWTLAQARDDMGKLLTWKSVSTLYLGWKTLIETHPEEKTGAVSFQEWAHLWKKKDAGIKNQFHLANWPAESIPDISLSDLHAFSPQTIKTQAVKTTDGGWPGCPIESLVLAKIDGIEMVRETVHRPQIPAGLFDDGRPVPKTIRVDVTKEDLGKVLSTQELPSGTLVIASGYGPRSSSPIVIQNTWIRIHFAQTEGYPLVISPRFVETGRNKDEAFISVTQGGVELVNGAFSIPASERQVLPVWFVQVTDGDFAIRQCRFQGPMLTSRNKGLIRWVRTGQPAPARPFAGELEGYGAISDCYLSGSGVLIEADMRRRALFIRNSIAVSRDDLFAIHLAGADSQIAGTVDLQQSTFSAASDIFRIEAAPLTAPTGSPLAFFVDRCVFAPPIKVGLKKPTPTLLAYDGPLLETRQVSWWENRNGYATDLAYFLRPAKEYPQPVPQSIEQSWVSQWGPEQVTRPLATIGAVVLKAELPHRSKLEPSDFELHPRSKAMHWDGSEKPIGANLEAMQLPETKGGSAPVGKAKTPKPANAPIQGF